MFQASQAPPKGTAPAPPARPADALPEGARLGEFEIRRVLGAGGFGIVYEAWDHALEREVALKEYLPVTLAGRGPGYRVTIRASNHDETFALGLRSFVNEARLLARFDHPSLLKVYRFWEDNGTAYMAMPLYHGRTLRQVRQAMAAGSPGETWVRTLVEPMLGALEKLHAEGVFHRDIAPDNILMTDEGRPVLLDFGAARRVIGDRTHALTAILKPHFAPIEQYADVSSVRQGPWTDLYGLAATVYYLLVGQPPLPAAARAIHDELVPLARLMPANCSLSFLQAMDWAMAVRPAERPQSAAIWRDVLEGRIDPPRGLRGDITVPGVTARAPAPARVVQTDFDPTQPFATAPPGAASAAAAPATARTAPSARAAEPAAGASFVHADGQRPVTVPHRAAPAPSPASAPAAASAVLPTTYPLIALAPRALRRPVAVPARWWLWSGAGSALVLIAAFTWVVSSRSQAAAGVPVANGAAAAVPTASAPQPAPLVAAAAAPPLSRPAQAARAEAQSSAAAMAPQPAIAQESDASTAPAPAPVLARAAPPRARHVMRETRHAAATESAEARCAGRNFLSRLICLKHECDSDPRLHADAACLKMRHEEDERRQALANH
jgi:hypothetical protein